MLEKEKNPPNPQQNLNKPLPLTHTTKNQGDGTVQFYIQNINFFLHSIPWKWT